MRIRLVVAVIASAFSFAQPTFAQQKETVDPHWSDVTVREGDTWKDRMEIANTTPAPAPTTTPSPTSSKQ